MDFREASLVHSTAEFNQFYCQEKKDSSCRRFLSHFLFFFLSYYYICFCCLKMQIYT